MSVSLREKYLSALGVVQYRRRSLRVVTAVEEMEAGADQPSRADLRAISQEQPPVSVASEIASVPTTPQQKERAEAGSEVGAEVGQLLKEAQSVLSDASYGFDLLVWRSEQILALEFSTGEQGSSGVKHQLANNILRALHTRKNSQAFRGVELHQYSWPIEAVAAGEASARTWLQALVAGHLQHQSDMPIWVMGEPGLKMLFPEQAEAAQLEELRCSRIRHEQLGVELFISPSLGEMLESAVAKAQTWQLLRSSG